MDPDSVDGMSCRYDATFSLVKQAGFQNRVLHHQSIAFSGAVHTADSIVMLLTGLEMQGQQPCCKHVQAWNPMRVRSEAVWPGG